MKIFYIVALFFAFGCIASTQFNNLGLDQTKIFIKSTRCARLAQLSGYMTLASAHLRMAATVKPKGDLKNTSAYQIGYVNGVMNTIYYRLNPNSKLMVTLARKEYISICPSIT